MRNARIWTASVVLLLLAIDAGSEQTALTDARQRRMSFHNRLLLNRAVISGLDRLEVLLMVHGHRVGPTSALVARLGGRVRRTVAAIDYMRVEIPIDKLLALIASTDIDAYQISSLSQASVYRDGAAEKEAEMWRRFETTSSIPTPVPLPTKDTLATMETLPALSVDRSRESGYTGEDDVGLGEWIKAHPTFDGRGVTIAILESALTEWTHPTIGHAKSLDGLEIPKIAGILNPIPADDPDDTRVELDRNVEAISAWCKIDGRTYIMPHPGHYRLGLYTIHLGSNLIERFGVLEDEATHDILVDTNGDADFRDEKPITDVNERMDIRALRVTYPRKTELSFVLTHGPAHTVNIYTATGDHQAMTLSVAAGSKSDDGLAFGVAPGARVLLVANQTTAFALHNLLEGFLDAAERPDVDVLACSEGIESMPDTAADFVGLFLSRIASAYHKPIFVAAGNDQLFPVSATAFAGAFSVGGSLGPTTFAALEGGAILPGLMVHHTGAAGPSIDGMIKPDFLAPVERVAASLWTSPSVPVPKNAPRFELPPGYEISCCTSSSTPYAAGIAAVLISGMKQERLPFSLEQFGRALKVGAHFLSAAPSFEQGNGVLDVNAAWSELHNSVAIPLIHTTAPIVHPLAAYAARGNIGQGIFEVGGWTAGTTGTREIQFRRESGPATPVTYRVDWTGEDGTFAAPEQLTLPLNRSVPLTITIAIHTNGPHSAILNLRDPATDAIVFRTQATIFVPEVVDPRTHAARFKGSVPLMQHDSRFVTVPDHVVAMSVELEVVHGSVMASILPGSGLLPLYSPLSRVYPEIGRTFTAGRYRVVLPYPVAGTWGIDLDNASARREHDQTLVRTETAEYALTITMLSAKLEPRSIDRGRLNVDVANLGAALGEPVLEASPAMQTVREGHFLPNGKPSVFDVDVPDAAATLVVQVHSQANDGSPLELYLYDCTSGECFNLDFTLPVAHEQTIVVRKPKAGRWRAAVNPGPLPAGAGGFVIDTIIATGGAQPSSASTQMRAPGDRWTEITRIAPAIAGSANGVLYELVDLAVQRDAAEHKWETRKDYPDMSELPAAVGMLFQPLDRASHK